MMMTREQRQLNDQRVMAANMLSQFDDLTITDWLSDCQHEVTGTLVGVFAHNKGLLLVLDDNGTTRCVVWRCGSLCRQTVLSQLAKPHWATINHELKYRGKRIVGRIFPDERMVTIL